VSLDLARYFVEFLCDESCGKCLPCREGLKRMREILGDIVCGRAEEKEMDVLRDVCDLMRKASLCAWAALLSIRF